MAAVHPVSAYLVTVVAHGSAESHLKRTRCYVGLPDNGSGLPRPVVKFLPVVRPDVRFERRPASLVRSSKACRPCLLPASIINDLQASPGSNRPLFLPMSMGLATVMATVRRAGGHDERRPGTSE
jgi:hypothetical protein